MFNKFLVTSLVAMGLSCTIYADDMSCKVQVAVATPPVEFNQSVAFNLTNDGGFSKSITLKGGSAPQFIEKLPCSNLFYTITATQYNTPSNDARLMQGIGLCSLRAGSISLNGSDNSVSVVFPYDFVCNN